MEKRCEFCKAVRSVVLCKSDAAHLCLSCDAKVHSANALSYRHLRTLVCESCSFQPALVRCFEHQMLMCQSCDIVHHVSLDHHKKIISCYAGCPCAKDLAELWGFNLNDKSIAFSHSSKVVNDDKQQKSSSYLIMQQIMELERLQLSEERHDSTFRMSEGPLLDETEPPLSSQFPQLDSSTNSGNGQTFWQPVNDHNNEIWLQNMQDLGVCEEVQCFEDVNIPDVDRTFRNFEEMFGGYANATTVEKHDESIQGQL